MGNDKKNDLIDKIKKVKQIKKIWLAIGAMLPILKTIIITMLATAIIFIPIMFFNNIKDGFFNGVDKLYNFFSLNGWMSSENVYYNKLEKEYELYHSYPYIDGEFDIPLLSATSHYVNMFGPNDFEYANEDKFFHEEDYDSKKLEHAVKEDTSRAFYKFAENELGTSSTFIPTSKKLIGHLVDVKIVTHCVKVEGLDDIGKLFKSYWDYWYTFSRYMWDSTKGSLKYFLNSQNIFRFVSLIHAYKQQGHSFTHTQMQQFKYIFEEDEDIVSEILRIIKQSDLSACDEAFEIPVPTLYRFINYENYKKYLKRFYLRQFYINCKTCPYKDLSEDDKDIIADRMIDEIFSQKEAWDYLTADHKTEYLFIPGMTTIPIQPSAGQSWRTTVSRGWQLGTAKCFQDGVWNGKTNCNHFGIDFAVPTGTPIYAIASGKVITAQFSGGYGNMVKLEHDVDGDGKADYYSVYAHMSKISVSKGQNVAGGQKIGEVGSTGNSSGPHLHFEVRDKYDRPINPEPILDAIETGGDNPLEGTISCGLIDGSKLTRLNEELENSINSAGFATREAVVAASRYLIVESGVKVPYWFGGKSAKKGFDAEWGCRKAIDSKGTKQQPTGSVHPFGLDCSGFVVWAIHNAGFKYNTIPHGSANQKNFTNQLVRLNATNIKQAKPGDLVWREGHIGIIESLNSETCQYRVAEAASASTGLVVRERNCYENTFSHIVLMDQYYNNANNKR